MQIHLYALCWNELDILPFFFRHYDRFVSRYFIFDNGSTDGSVTYLLGNPKVELHPFRPSQSESFVLSEQSFSDQCWKQSRGAADWVIVTDLDEHLYHPDLIGLLGGYKKLGVTLAPALGFEMVSEEFPHPDEMLCETRTRGTPSGYYSKLSIFDPDAIHEITYGPGRHWASPTGYLAAPPTDELRLFHYKHVGFERTRRRYHQLHGGLGTTDVENRWDVRYAWSDERFTREWRDLCASAIGVDDPAATSHFPPSLWWEPLRIDPLRSEANSVRTHPGGAILVGREIRQFVEDFPDLLQRGGEAEQ